MVIGPKWIMDEGLIGSNPGMGYRPMPDPDKNADSTLVWFRMGNFNTTF
jgi:sodium/potassium-transporting ATPase subunit beta